MKPLWPEVNDRGKAACKFNFLLILGRVAGVDRRQRNAHEPVAAANFPDQGLNAPYRSRAMPVMLVMKRINPAAAAIKKKLTPIV